MVCGASINSHAHKYFSANTINKEFDVLFFTRISQSINQQEAHQLVGQAKRHIRPKVVWAAVSTIFSNCDIYRPEVADDVVTGMAVEQVGLDVRGKFCDSR